MTIRLITGALAVALVLTVAVGVGFTEDKPAEKERPKPMSEGEMWGHMMKAAQPGPMHKLLGTMCGTWKCKGKIFSETMGEMPITGTSVNKAVLDGRFVETVYEGPFMGGTYKARGSMGYDNMHKTFERTWTSTMGTFIDVMRGSYDEKTKTITWKGTWKGPDGVTYYKRAVYEMKSDDVHVETAYAKAWKDGKEKKEMTLTFTRVKDEAGK